MREFWAKGYRDTSVGDLVAATGVRPGSLYGVFEGGKHQIFIEALKLYSVLSFPRSWGRWSGRVRRWRKCARISTVWSATS